MPLAEVQAALARLVTDSEARAAFHDDPVDVAQRLGLAQDDIKAIARGLDKFAGTLNAKRRLDAAKRLPLPAQALGEDFARRFRPGLIEPAPGTRADALAFVRRLVHEPDRERPWLADLARYEAGFLQTREGGLRLGVFRYPVEKIAQALGAGAAISPLARLTVVLWARWPGGRLVFRVWPQR